MTAPGPGPYARTTLGLELIDVTGYDSGVLRQRYRPAT